MLADLDPKDVARHARSRVPIVNVLGFMNGDRYLPDRRDLNRSFPGSARGSLASRIAHLLMTEVVAKCEVGHRPAHRLRPPLQPAADPRRPRRRPHPGAGRGLRGAGDAARPASATARCATRPASAARRCCSTRPARACGSTHYAIDAGVVGVRRVLAALGMVDAARPSDPPPAERRVRGAAAGSARGVRASSTSTPSSGSGSTDGERLGALVDSFGKTLRLVHANRDRDRDRADRAPLVNSGDALVHIGSAD